MADIKFEVTKHIGVLSEGSRGWRKEVNLISWNERDPKYDIRDWAPERAKMGKGITLSDSEIAELKRILSEIDD